MSYLTDYIIESIPNGALDNLEAIVADVGMGLTESVDSVTTILRPTSAITQGAVSAAS